MPFALALAADHDVEERGVGLRRHVAQVLDPAARRRAVAQRAVGAVELLARAPPFSGDAGQRGRRRQLRAPPTDSGGIGGSLAFPPSLNTSRRGLPRNNWE